MSYPRQRGTRVHTWLLRSEILEVFHILTGQISCNAGFTNCGGTCVNLQTNTSNCGACGVVCSSNNMASTTCSSGQCTVRLFLSRQLISKGTCNTGFRDCTGNLAVNGCETNVATSTINCGACGVLCPTPTNGAAVCTSGVCGVGNNKLLYLRSRFRVTVDSPTALVPASTCNRAPATAGFVALYAPILPLATDRLYARAAIVGLEQ